MESAELCCQHFFQPLRKVTVISDVLFDHCCRALAKVRIQTTNVQIVILSQKVGKISKHIVEYMTVDKITHLHTDRVNLPFKIHVFYFSSAVVSNPV